MAIISTNALTSYDSNASASKTAREQVEDAIFNIDPTETMMLSTMSRRDVSNTLFEWLTESLPASADNLAALEGNDMSLDARTLATRNSNNCQINARNATVTGTQEALSNYGKASGEMAHQLSLISKAIKIDMEKTILSHNPLVDGAEGTARQTRSFTHWLTSNDFRGGGGSHAGTATGSITNGTPRELTEDIFVTAMESMYDNGAEFDTVIAGPANKREISDFAGRSGTQVVVDANTVTSNVTLYASDFGDVKVAISRHIFKSGSTASDETDVLFVDFDYTKLAMLRPFTIQERGRTSDAETKQLIAEWGVQVDNEKAHGVISDLKPVYAGGTA